MQDMAAPEIWIERYHSPNWVEHLRRHHRFTVSDREIERKALDFHQGTRASACEAPDRAAHRRAGGRNDRNNRSAPRVRFSDAQSQRGPCRTR